MADSKIWASPILKILGPDSFAEFHATRAGGKIIWCNFELARQMGFDVPRSNQITPEFENQLVSALSFTAVEKGSQPEETITMYADRYGGDGVYPGLGAGRAGFLPYGNLYVKGIGFTPLFKHNNPNDFVHSHGAVYLADCITEALFGEVDENLFTLGSARILAIIDQGKCVTDPRGRRIPAALAVRAGNQLRPAHLLISRKPNGRSALDRFVSITSATEQLVLRQNGSRRSAIPDVKATLLRVIDDHALTAAEGFRWRLIHGAISSSNMEMSGAMLDLPTQSTQPRTAPIKLLNYVDSVFGTEHQERALRLTIAYRRLMLTTPGLGQEHFNVRWFDIAGEMEKAYARHLQVKLLGACGFKSTVAEWIRSTKPELASRFAKLIQEMCALRNPGSVSVSKTIAEEVSVLDVFHLLKRFPSIYFKEPTADHRDIIFSLLIPVFRGSLSQIARKRTKVDLLVSRFADCYRELMQACQSGAEEHYGDSETMAASISARAAFENEPLDQLYYFRLHAEIDKAIASYQANGDVATIRQAIDQRVTASLRNVDAILAQGNCRYLPDGGIELQRRTIDGINYSVRVWKRPEQIRRLHVSIFATQSGAKYFTTVTGLNCLTKRQIQSLRYRYRTSGQENFAEVKASLKHDQRDGLLIDFNDICDFPLVGRLEGAFYMHGSGAKTGTPHFADYVFAIPDRNELMTVITERL